ncbi:tetraspanin-15-like isoform X4 [Hemitrygon akajei]|uniref:tetraspanin-15-like isoform X4 n=1 Tax=Hemitrygon akajei TaxID=2704970 RepID=UPI003BFA3115
MGGRCRLHCTGADAAYYVLKLTLGVSATLFSMLGLLIMCVGIYAEVERQRNKTMEGFFVAPAVFLVLLGVSIFAVSFVGMVGALRDNQLLLKIFKWTLVTVVLLEMIFIIVSFVCRNKVLLVFKANVREGIKHYYEDLDFKNILDRIQTKEDDVVNTQCGYYTLNLERFEVDDIIHVRGCVDAISLWFEDNVSIAVGILAAIILPQMLGILLSCLYLVKLSQYPDEVDGFRVRIPYELLDLSGAGWCMCLPKAEGYQAKDDPVDPYSMHPLQDTQVMDTKEEELN